MRTTAAIALLVMFSGSVQAGFGQTKEGRVQLVQATTPRDSAHTLFQPNAPDPGRVGQTVPLPGGGFGVTTGGTAGYQTLGTPNGSALAVPNGNNTSSVIGPGGRAGIVSTPR